MQTEEHSHRSESQKWEDCVGKGEFALQKGLWSVVKWQFVVGMVVIKMLTRWLE
jgi:hypothetical protein